MQGRAEAPAHVESKENRVDEEEEEEEEEDEEDEKVEEENDEEEFTLYCYCQKQSWKVDDDDTVQCGGCGELYHFECLRKVGCAVDPTLRLQPEASGFARARTARCNANARQQRKTKTRRRRRSRRWTRMAK